MPAGPYVPAGSRVDAGDPVFGYALDGVDTTPESVIAASQARCLSATLVVPGVSGHLRLAARSLAARLECELTPVIALGVSAHVAHEASCSVLIVRHQTDTGP